MGVEEREIPLPVLQSPNLSGTSRWPVRVSDDPKFAFDTVFVVENVEDDDSDSDKLRTMMSREDITAQCGAQNCRSSEYSHGML